MGRLGCRVQSSISSKSMPGLPKAGKQASGRSFKPLAPCTTVTTWKRGKPAFWEQLKIRFQLALKQPQQQAKGPTMGFMQAIHDAPKHWVGPPTWGQFLDTCHHTGVAMLQIWSTTPLGTNFKKPNTPPMMKVTSNTKNGCSKPRPKGSKGSSAAFEVVS